jgi:hypothetical protein
LYLNIQKQLKIKTMENNKQKGNFTMDIHEEITKKAYEIWEQKGRMPGHDLENWFEAKRMIDENRGKENEGGTNEGEEGRMGMGMHRHGMKEGMHHGKNC